jgi:hypothetical protein
MRQGSRIIISLLVIFTFALTMNGQAAAQAQVEKPAAGPAAKAHLKVVIEGKIKNLPVMGGYYILSSPEVYKIANKNPQILEELAQSGRTVSIEARAQGDLLTIEKIDGQTYSGGQAPGAR